MKLEIYVVTTKHPNVLALENIQKQLCDKFGGLTIIPNCKGLWKNDVGNLESDKVEIWRCLTTQVVLPSEAIRIGELLNTICDQQETLITVNDVPYLITKHRLTLS